MVGCWWRGRLPTVPEPRLRRDVVFATLPGSGRKLVCDLWQPPAGVPLSGLAWSICTAAPGACWTRTSGRGRCFATWPSRATWSWTWPTGCSPRPTSPAELAGSYPGVCGVVSLYGQADLAAHYDHTSQHKTCRPDDPQPDWDAPPPPWMRRLFGPDVDRLKLVPGGRLDWPVGGTPSQLPDRYAQLSPLHRVHPGCPPTLLVHGDHDQLAPVAAMRRLQRRLEQAGVPVTGVYLPHTDHGFDLLATTWSPPARVAIHVLERLLAVQAATDRTSAPQPISGSSAEPAALPQARPV